MATVAELKAQADNLGVKYTSKTRKPELEEMVAKAWLAKSAAEVKVESKPAQKVAEPMSNENRARVYATQRGAHWLELGEPEMIDRPHTPRQARRIKKHNNRAKGLQNA